MSDKKKKIYKPRPVSGFPEWLPEVRIVELEWMDYIRSVFESYGYASIETPSVEELNVIEAKSSDGGDDADKEIYVLERLHKQEGDKEARLALHFDQTVPLARYTAQHFNNLVFPFKRYQMQRVWRGERPQAGRFREFYQCDIDVIGVDSLPIHFDAEMPAIIWKILSSLPGMDAHPFQILISNRKILIGFLQAMNVEDITQVTRWIDKLDKLHPDLVRKELTDLGLTSSHIDLLLKVAEFKTRSSAELKSFIDSLPFDGERDDINGGVKELSFVLDQLAHLPEGSFTADLSIVRGLDYYTGTVYETRFINDPTYGSICSGGRYDDLASHYISRHLPGVGISIGFSRLFDYVMQKAATPITRKTPTEILVVLPSEEQRSITAQTARTLRSRGFKVEQYHAPQKVKKQLAYAEKKGISYVWFPPFDEGASHEVKSMETGEQLTASPEDWNKS
jgi:histidyl-tRNA synthetase